MLDGPVIKSYTVIYREKVIAVYKRSFFSRYQKYISFALGLLILATVFNFSPFASASDSVTYSSTVDFKRNAVLGPDGIPGTSDDNQLGVSTTLDGVSITGGTVALAGDGFIDVAVGSDHILAVHSDGTLWAWGNNDSGQLGLGGYDNNNSPTQVGTDTDWQNVATAVYGSFAIKTDGTLWAWGYNLAGQLGLSADDTYYTTPTQVGTDTDWHDVASSYYASVGLKTNGTVWTWGSNDYVGLGRGDAGDTDTPTQVGTDTDWNKIASMDTYVLAIKNNGTLWGWGYNGSGELGLGDYDSRDVPTQIGVDTDWQSLTSGMPNFTDASFAIKTDGTLWAWGYNVDGQLGLGDTAEHLVPTQVGTDTDWQSVASANAHSLAIKTDGTLWATGSNAHGELGIDGIDNAVEFDQVGTDTDWQSAYAGNYFSVAIKADGSVYSWGADLRALPYDATIPGEVAGSAAWQAAGVGRTYSVAIKTDGTLWGWGSNDYGQLGVGDEVNRDVPTQVGTDTNWVSVAVGSADYFFVSDVTLAIKTDGTLWAWGSNGNGELGLSDSANRNVPTQVGTDTNWQQCTVGGGFSMCLKTDGTLWSTGWNGYKQLGLGDGTNRDQFTQIGSDTNWAQVSATYYSAGAVKNDGTLWTWGSAAFNRLGLPAGPDRSAPTQVGTDSDWILVSMASSSGFAIKDDHTLWAWGINWYGELGRGDTVDQATPVQVGTDTNWASVAAGNFHTIASKLDGTLWAWGANLSGQLGNGTIDEDPHTSPIQVGADTDWATVFTNSDTGGVGHILVLKNDGRLYAWGNDSSFQLGRNTPNEGSGLLIDSSYMSTGSLTGLIINAGGVAIWDHVSWVSASLPAGTSVGFRVRTSDNGIDYSAWSDSFIQSAEGSTEGTAGLSTINSSQYLEIELTLMTDNPTYSPMVNSFALSYNLEKHSSSGSVADTFSHSSQDNSAGGSCMWWVLDGSCLYGHTSNETFISPAFTFLRNLSMGMVGVDVQRLQQFLNQNHFTVSQSGAGSSGQETIFFGPKTYQALISFQEFYKDKILTPLGLTAGTGYFGDQTRGFVNSIINK